MPTAGGGSHELIDCCLADYQRSGRLSGVAVATCAEVLFDLDERQAARDVLRAEYDRLAADPEHGPDAPETLVALNNAPTAPTTSRSPAPWPT